MYYYACVVNTMYIYTKHVKYIGIDLCYYWNNGLLHVLYMYMYTCSTIRLGSVYQDVIKYQAHDIKNQARTNEHVCIHA